MALKQIKSQIRATDRTRKVTKAMEAVSAVKMRKGQERALLGRAYAATAFKILSRVSGSQSAKNHPLALARTGNRTLIFLITSDKGLAGSLNSAVIKEALKATESIPKEHVSFVCLGKRGYEFFEKRGYRVLAHRVNMNDIVLLEDMTELTAIAIEQYVVGNTDKVLLTYQNFKSTFEQEPVLRQVFPLDAEALEEAVKGITPTYGKYYQSNYQTEKDAKVASTYTIEPSEEVVIGELFPRLANILIYHALLESKASEHSARMVAMKNATDKAKDVSRLLNLKYNKARQAAITREVSEITGGIEAMAQAE